VAPEPREPLLRAVWSLLRGTVARSLKDDLATRAAALAFFTMLSLSPLLVLLLYGITLLQFDAQDVLVEQVRVLLGATAGAAVQELVSAASADPTQGRLSALLSLGALLLMSTAVFVQLRYTLNHVWNVPSRPSRGARGWLRRRALSFAMLGVLGVLLIVSLVVTTVVHTVLHGDGPSGVIGTELASGAVLAVAFLLFYRLIPDAVVAWGDATVGGVATAVLFGVGKYAIAAWLGQSNVGSSYGAAGSLMVLLVWVYYSALILLVGAELTRSWSNTFGGGIVAKDFTAPESAELGRWRRRDASK